ncbi:MAG: hypothetical protein WCK89_06280 [bacterium]
MNRRTAYRRLWQAPVVSPVGLGGGLARWQNLSADAGAWRACRPRAFRLSPGLYGTDFVKVSTSHQTILSVIEDQEGNICAPCSL